MALLPTLITDDDDVMQRAHQAICQALGPQQIAGILGVHYEGPYLNPLRKGVHHENKIRPSGLSSIEKRLNNMKNVLEFSKNEQLVAYCKDMGII